MLALRWRDLDVTNKTLRIERSVEETKKFGLQFKEPKRARHKRTIAINADLITLLVAEREKYLRMVAGVPDGSAVNLPLVRLPDDALMFPNVAGNMDIAAPQHPRNTSKEVKRRVVPLGFTGMRPFHDPRVTHEASPLDDGVHVVAGALRPRPGRAAARLRQAHPRRRTRTRPQPSAGFRRAC